MPSVLHEVSPEVRARGGELLRAFAVEDGRWRLATTPADVDPNYLEALVSYEDKRFYQHAGVDPLALVRAAAQALTNGEIVSGGSTLTMQVARLIENGSTGSWRGKLRQIRIALALERSYSKPEILTLYLTHAPFGSNIEGLRAASFAYFGKEPRRLSPAQIALLVALPQAPEARRPDRYPHRALLARNAVLNRLATNGLMETHTLELAMDQAVPTALNGFPARAFHAAARAARIQPDARRINLTIDADLQERLEDLAQSRAQSFDPKTTIAMVVADHTTGDVLASIGASSQGTRGAPESFLDMTRAIRSPGSALKPLVYAMAFDLGLAHPETIINDGPIRFGSYAPSNFDGGFRGEITLREALQTSLNTPVVALLDRIGPERFIQRLKEAGATAHIQGGKPGLAVALGGMGISLHDMTALFAGLAQGGRSVQLKEVLGEGQDTRPRQFMSPSAAWQVGDILSSATSRNARLAGGIAFKTGTSYGYRDNWAIGYDGRYVVGVWVGRPDGTPMQRAFARDTAAPLLAQAFGYVTPKANPLPAPPPETYLVGTAQLPKPLQRFTLPNANAPTNAGAPDIVFPPKGARLAAMEELPFLIKLRGGKPPYAVFANDELREVSTHATSITLGNMRPGFFDITVIDAKGRAARTKVEIR